MYVKIIGQIKIPFTVNRIRTCAGGTILHISSQECYRYTRETGDGRLHICRSEKHFGHMLLS